MKVQKMQDLDLDGKKVFLRCDFNVPLDRNGNIINFKRINSIIETIEYLLKKDCALIIGSHLSRPQGFEHRLSMKIIQRVLRSLLRWPIKLAPGVVDVETLRITNKIKSGEIILLENLRYDPREKRNSQSFAKKLASMVDFYVNDAFGVCHRKHASIDAITSFFDIKHKGAGFLLQKEVSYFLSKIKKYNTPFIVILGGSKVSGKLQTIKKLLEVADSIIIGGAMAFTFLKALGYETGKSLIEENLLNEALDILKKADALGKTLYLPQDFLISETFGEGGKIKTVTASNIPPNLMGLDIGPKSIALFEQICSQAKTIFWNGPMGAYEMNSFFMGSAGIVNILAKSKALTFVGGGDSLSVIHKMGVYHDIDFLSTGGGASLELLEGRKLPGLENLKV